MKNGKLEQKDIDILNEIYNENEEHLTVVEFREMVEELIEGNEGPSKEEQETVEFWSIILNDMSGCESVVLNDKRDQDGYSYIYDIMRTLHYDNGEPLSCDDYDYFEHYDRDQDFWGFFEGEYIDHFELSEDGTLLVVMEMTEEDLRDYLTDMYDGSSWEHDFGDD